MRDAGLPAAEQGEIRRAEEIAMRQDAAARGKDISGDSELGKWLVWATAQADRLDPLKESPPSILDDEAKYKEPERPRFW